MRNRLKSRCCTWPKPVTIVSSIITNFLRTSQKRKLAWYSAKRADQGEIIGIPSFVSLTTGGDLRNAKTRHQHSICDKDHLSVAARPRRGRRNPQLGQHSRTVKPPHHIAAFLWRSRKRKASTDREGHNGLDVWFHLAWDVRHRSCCGWVCDKARADTT